MSCFSARYVMRDQVRHRVEEIMASDPRGEVRPPSFAYGALVVVGAVLYLMALSASIA